MEPGLEPLEGRKEFLESNVQPCIEEARKQLLKKLADRYKALGIASHISEGRNVYTIKHRCCPPLFLIFDVEDD